MIVKPHNEGGYILLCRIVEVVERIYGTKYVLGDGQFSNVWIFTAGWNHAAWKLFRILVFGVLLDPPAIQGTIVL